MHEADSNLGPSKCRVRMISSNCSDRYARLLISNNFNSNLWFLFQNKLYLGMRKPNWQSSSNLYNIQHRSEPTLELYSRAMSSVGVMYNSSCPNTWSNSGGGWIQKKVYPKSIWFWLNIHSMNNEKYIKISISYTHLSLFSMVCVCVCVCHTLCMAPKLKMTHWWWFHRRNLIVNKNDNPAVGLSEV